MGEHIYTYADPPSERDLTRTCKVLENDGLLAYPMGLNWAFGCDAGSVKALERIRLLKPGHPMEKSFSLLCSDISMASRVGNIDHSLYRVLKKIWPGPYTILVRRHRSLPKMIRDKRQIVGIRVPDCDFVRALVARYDKPLATTSVPEKPDGGSCIMGYEVYEHFGHGVDLVLDLGEELPGGESTVVDFSSGSPEVIRVGAGDPSVFG